MQAISIWYLRSLLHVCHIKALVLAFPVTDGMQGVRWTGSLVMFLLLRMRLEQGSQSSHLCSQATRKAWSWVKLFSVL